MAPRVLAQSTERTELPVTEVGTIGEVTSLGWRIVSHFRAYYVYNVYLTSK